MISEMKFMMSIDHLEDLFKEKLKGGAYTHHEKQAFKRSVFQKYQPTDREWATALEELESLEWPPKIHEMKSAFIRARKNTALVYVDCAKCRKLGFLFFEAGDGFRFAAGCGCENTPGHIERTELVSYYVKEKGADAMRFESVKGRKLHENDEDFNARRWASVVELYKNGKWVPRWMRERFDMGCFTRPEPGEWPKNMRGQLGDMPRVGESHGG